MAQAQAQFPDYMQRLIAAQKQGAPPLVKGDLTGKTVMITGANSGIGYEAAVHFATMNPARLLLVCRSVEKAQESIATLEAATGYKKAEPMALDLGRFSSISEFATQVEKSVDRIDILVENAAVITGRQYIPTEDGWETMLQVNALGPALHTLLLLPALMNSAKQLSVPRIVIVSSGVIQSTTIKSDAIAAPNCLRMLSDKDFCDQSELQNRYALTKILNIMFMRKLAKLLPRTIVPVALNPGFCFSGLRRHQPPETLERFKKMDEEYGFTSEEGSHQIIYSAVGGTDEEVRGAYISFSKPEELPSWMFSEEGQKAEEKIWKEMLDVFEELDHRTTGIVSQYLS